MISTSQDSPFLAQRARAREITVPYRRRRAERRVHPVYDFLFTYYPFSPAQLEKWHPGPGVVLELADYSAEEIAHLREDRYYFTETTVRLAPEKMSEKARDRLRRIHNLLVLTQSRAGKFGCYGMHEWAMVYQGGDVRHRESAPLRLPQAEIDRLVETRPIACSHFDAFRFFAPAAVSFNKLQPTLEDREKNEQPGCLHTNMDLYKWASKAMPWVGSEIVWQSFQLALKTRELDMRASPYDLSEYGYAPIKIETEQGRAQYEVEQREIAEAGKVLRGKLIEVLALSL